MNKKLIVIAGHLAAGKTTFALKLSKELNIPSFCKDLIKNALGTNIIIKNREDDKRLSAATFDAITFITERFMETHMPLIVEANFVNNNHASINEAAVLQALVEKYHYRTLTFLFTGKANILRDRFIKRGSSLSLTQEEFERVSFLLGCFDIGGKTEKIDTTEIESVDFAHHIETARKFIGQDEVDFNMF